MTQIVKVAQKPVIATDVRVELVGHPDVIWRFMGNAPGSNFITQDIGNATSETDITFQYTFKKTKKLLDRFPFQVTKYMGVPKTKILIRPKYGIQDQMVVNVLELLQNKLK